jgi:uncharacterized damage-inducible protein DinB
MTPEERNQKINEYASAYDLLTKALANIPGEIWQYKPGPERWSIHEIILHIADSEANSYVRCRRFIAESGLSVMAYDEDTWARELRYHDLSPEDAIELFKCLRQLTYQLIQSLPSNTWANTVEHPENGTMTLDDWLEIYANHVTEHIQQIKATHNAWLAEQEGQAPDPDKSLFKFQ